MSTRAQTIRTYIGFQAETNLKEILEMLLDEIELLEARIVDLERPEEPKKE